MRSGAVWAPVGDLLAACCGVLGGELLAFEALFGFFLKLPCLEAATLDDYPVLEDAVSCGDVVSREYNVS